MITHKLLILGLLDFLVVFITFIINFYSYRQLPQKRQRRKRIDDIEKTLLEHPLAVFPHFEESLPHDVRT